MTDGQKKPRRDCPNCREGVDDDDCPHLRADDPCQNCGSALEKPPAGKVRCSNCRWVVNGQNEGYELPDFNLTYRQAVRLLTLFGYDHPGTPGSTGTALRGFCRDHGVQIRELNDVLADIRGLGGYADAE